MKIKVLITLTIALATLQSCMYQKPETIANKDIENSIRITIKEKNDSLINAMVKSDNKILTQLGSPSFVKYMRSRLGNVIWAFRGGLTNQYTVFDEFYNTHSSAPDNSVIKSEDHGYTFSFQNDEKETYVSLLKVIHNTIDDYLITVIYSKIGNDWKIEQLEVGQLGIYGKTAHDLFNEAKKYKQNDFPVDAFFYLDAANSFLHPAGKMLEYDQETKMGVYTPLWANEVNSLYKFPKPLDNIKTQPVLGGITCVKNTEGFFPLVSYVTQIPVKDTTAIAQEYEQIKKVVEKTYTGMDFKKPFIYYRAYNLYPGSTELGDSFLIRDERIN